MPVTPESIYEFAAVARRSLLQSDVLRKRVLLPRLLKRQSTTRCTTRFQSTGTAHSCLSPPIQFYNPAEVIVTSEEQSSVPTKRGPGTGWAHIFPTTCPGCGALSQTSDHHEPGFYSKSRRAVKTYLRHRALIQSSPINRDMSSTNDENRPSQGQSDTGMDMFEKTRSTTVERISQLEPPVCDRCHDLIYNNQGQSIAHPTLENLADSIAESPFRRNHVYHVIDAADFPMSLVPNIFKTLELAKPRSQNRRARTKFTTKPSISFIITRSDLLGPSKQMVDKMMPYFQSLLRAALGRQGKDMRLGNVHLVSAKRGWWTKEIKDSIWERGGGNWMVGKVNVGKSNLFPVLFPKASGDRAHVYTEIEHQQENNGTNTRPWAPQEDNFQKDSLLPPSQPEVPFPAMPVVSHLPGTTASPIRLPFGNHKGELIDLPGLERGALDDFVHPDHKQDIVMQYRPNVTQHVIKPGQSLLLGGGLVRITPHLDPHDRSTTMLAYPFVPIDAHVTATDKAVVMQLQQRESGIKSIIADDAGSSFTSAGMYNLTTDVTKFRASALARAGVPLSKLPFRVYSSDILIEGVGWVELVCQVRKLRSSSELDTKSQAQAGHIGTALGANDGVTPPTSPWSERSSIPPSEFKPFSEHSPVSGADETLVQEGFPLPQVEVFSPRGRHISHRRPLGAWMLWHEAKEQRRKASTNIRPRKSMKGAKKKEKLERRLRNTA